MRCVIPQPCIGSSASVLRISRSSVPCNRSDFDLLMVTPPDNLQKNNLFLVDYQGESNKAGRSGLSGQLARDREKVIPGRIRPAIAALDLHVQDVGMSPGCCPEAAIDGPGQLIRIRHPFGFYTIAFTNRDVVDLRRVERRTDVAAGRSCSASVLVKKLPIGLISVVVPDNDRDRDLVTGGAPQSLDAELKTAIAHERHDLPVRLCDPGADCGRNAPAQTSATGGEHPATGATLVEIQV